MLTLSEAAKETGLTRSAIFKAIRAGRISATRDDKGHFQIDPAELFRVYKPFSDPVDVRKSPEPTDSTLETAVLSARLEMLEQVLRQVERERDDLRRRLDEEGAERRQWMTRLAPPVAPLPPEPPVPTVPRWIPVLLVVLSCVVIGALALGLWWYGWPSLEHRP